MPEGIKDEIMVAHNKASANEKLITPELSEIVEKCGCSLAGLEFRIKTIESFQRKVETDMGEKGLQQDTVISNMRDLVRYTSVSMPENLVNDCSIILNDLESKGYSLVEVKNTWTDSRNPYNGINVTLMSPNGQKFELQFHTPQSLEVKEVMHKLYEEARLPTTTLERKNELAKQMSVMSHKLIRPKNIEHIQNRKFPVIEQRENNRNNNPHERISLDERVKQIQQSIKNSQIKNRSTGLDTRDR